MVVSTRPQRWLPLALFLGLALALTGGWFFTIHAANAEARERDRVLAEQTALRVGDWVDSRLALLRSMRSLAQSGQVETPADWNEHIRHAIKQIHGFQAINWIDAHGVITKLAPVRGNEAALGRNVLDHPVVGATLREAMADFQDRLSPPLDLYQGGRGFTAYIPVRDERDGTLLGVVDGVFRADQLAAACIDNLDPSHFVRIADGADTLIETHGFDTLTGVPAQVAIHLGDRSWTLSLQARTSSSPLAVSTLVFGACLLLSAGLAWLLGIALARQDKLIAANAHRTRIEARLRAAERLEAMGHLAGGVAHDFNNLLTVILGHTDLLGYTLAEDPEDHAALTESVDAIRDASVRAASVTGQLLAFARREPVTHGIVDAAAHLRTLTPMLRHLATEAVSLALDLPDTPLWAACPPGVLDRVLVNLVANARDATDARGDVMIRARRDGESVRIDVQDNGRGMAKEVLAHIFEPFFTTRPNGSGLGLATVHGLVNQRGGSVEASSIEGKGTTFTVRFRAGVPPTESSASTSATQRATAATDAHRPNVRLVEDNDAVRATLVRALSGGGFAVDDFGDGESALAHPGTPDLLVTDLVLPGLDGVTVATRLLERNPHLRVVIISGYSEQPGAVDELVARGARFIAKPFQMHELVDLARALTQVGAAPTHDPNASCVAVVDSHSQDV